MSTRIVILALSAAVLAAQAQPSHAATGGQPKPSSPNLICGNVQSPKKSAPTGTWTPVSVANAPEARYLHTSIWTGNELIIWGGTGLLNYLNTGALYYPTTDTWVPMTLTGAPSGRTGHNSAWTGSQLIVWGGYDGPSGYRNTGARYSMLTRSWLPMSTRNAPSARQGAVSVWADGVAPTTTGYFIVWGGAKVDTLYQDGGRYDPATDSWNAEPMSLTGAPSKRVSAAAVWDGTLTYNGTNEMLIWGGAGPGGFMGSGARYNPTSNTWTPMNRQGAPTPRKWVASAWTGHSPTYHNDWIIWGGFSYRGDLNDGAKYDPWADVWTPMATAGAPSARDRSSATWVPQGFFPGEGGVFIWGGVTLNTYFKDGAVYCPQQDTWEAISPAPADMLPRYWHTGSWTAGRLMIWGGLTPQGYTNQGYKYDPNAGE